jgi:DNA repair exonuclease SbcCD ATPase subunit
MRKTNCLFGEGEPFAQATFCANHAWENKEVIQPLRRMVQPPSPFFGVPMSRTVTELEWCSAAVLPEKLGVDENDLEVREDRIFDAKEAMALVEDLQIAAPVVAVKAMVPKLPAEVAKAVEEIRARLPKAKGKLNALLQIDPETGEETWRKTFEDEIVQRNQAVKVEFRSCKGCKSTIAVAQIRSYLCPACLTHPWLLTATDSKDLEKKLEKIKTLRDEIDGADQRIAELEAEGKANTDDLKRVWLVFKAEAAS